MGGSGYWAICRARGLRLNHERFHETPNGLRNLLMYNLIPQLLRCRRSYRKTKRLQTDKSTHKCTLILLYVIIMLKTSLEIAFRLIFHDSLIHGRERVNSRWLKVEKKITKSRKKYFRNVTIFISYPMYFGALRTNINLKNQKSIIKWSFWPQNWSSHPKSASDRQIGGRCSVLRPK